MSVYRLYGKRVFDVMVGAVACVVFSPVFLLLAAMVRASHGSPVLFRQRRAGQAGRPFELFKLRSMTNACDQNGVLLPDDRRITRLGHFLRKTSLDELPQLVNVLRGEMSLVGPRPLLLQYVDRYTPRHRRRLEPRPGITGWAQVRGRQDLPFSKRFELDVWYVENVSFFLDVKILVLTVLQVFRGRGVHTTQNVSDVDDLGLWSDNGRVSGDTAGEAEDNKETHP
jgi:sugar transferase EpsL